MLKKHRLRHLIVYAVTVLLSLVFLYVGHRVTAQGITSVFSASSGLAPEQAVVTMILDRSEEDYDLGGTSITNVTVRFIAKINNGAQKGDELIAVQSIDGYLPSGLKEVAVGDRVLIAQDTSDPTVYEWMFVEYLRTDALLVIGIVFAVLLLLFGGLKGFNTLLSLALTCAAVFFVFIPAILSGYNIYAMSIVICFFTIVTSLLIINGPDKKTFTAIVGCAGGVLLAGLITLVSNVFLRLSGYTDEDATFLAMLDTPNPIDLKAIIFAAILIGAMGAIMDVAMSIASALYEVSVEAKTPTFTSLLRSGFSMGRDMMGTMSTTLILAYIGSSLSVVLLLIVYSPSVLHLLNREMIVVEILQSLVGSLAILFTIPFTSLLCAAMYSHKKSAPADVLASSGAQSTQQEPESAENDR